MPGVGKHCSEQASIAGCAAWASGPCDTHSPPIRSSDTAPHVLPMLLYVGPRSYPRPYMLYWVFPAFLSPCPTCNPPPLLLPAPFSLCSTSSVKRVDQRTQPGLFVQGLWEPPRSPICPLLLPSACHSPAFVPSPQQEPFAYVPRFKERECYASQSHPRRETFTARFLPAGRRSQQLRF